MVGPLADDHLRQQARSRRTLLDRRSRLGGRLYRASAVVGEAGILDHLHLRGDVFIALAEFLADSPQVLIALRTVLFRFGQVVLNALAL